MKQEKRTADEILDMADDGRVLLFNRSTVLLRQVQEDKIRSIEKYRREITRAKDKIKRTQNKELKRRLKQRVKSLEAEIKQEQKFL